MASRLLERSRAFNEAEEQNGEMFNSLLQTYEEMLETGNKIEKLKLCDIRPYKSADGRSQPRHIDEQRVMRIMASANENGQLQPIIVKPLQNEEFKYEILCGHHRYEAFKKLGWENLEAVIIDCDENEAYRILAETNLEELTPSEMGQIINEYLKMRGIDNENNTAKEIAQKFGISKKTMYIYLNIISLDNELWRYIDNKFIPIKKVEKIKSSLNGLQQISLAQFLEFYEKKLSAKMVDKLCEYAKKTTNFTNDELYELMFCSDDNDEISKKEQSTIYSMIENKYPEFSGISKEEMDELIIKMFSRYYQERSEENG